MCGELHWNDDGIWCGYVFDGVNNSVPCPYATQHLQSHYKFGLIWFSLTCSLEVGSCVLESVMSEGYSCGCSDSDSSCGCWATAAAAGSRSEASTELKLYRAFIFCVPIFFTLILLFLFYLFYLRPRTRLHWITHFGVPNNDDDESNHNAISTVSKGTLFLTHFHSFAFLCVEFASGCCSARLSWAWTKNSERCCPLFSTRKASLLKIPSEFILLNHCSFPFLRIWFWG